MISQVLADSRTRYKHYDCLQTLMSEKIKWAKAQGLEFLETKVGVSNHACIGMRNRLGYVVTGLGMSITGKPVLTMRLKLA